MSRSIDDDENSSQTTITGLVLGSLLMFMIGGWWGNWSHNEYGFWWAWKYPTTLVAGLTDVWYIFAWAFGYTAIVASILIWKRIPGSGRPGKEFLGGLGVSAFAGLWEEIVFRWILLLGAPASLTLLNWITCGLTKWVYTEALIPLANWATFGILQPQLTGQIGTNWVMAGAILTAAAAFRNGHKYLGPLGYINSWFIGMVMFYLVFNHGIITAIVAHFLYDLIIFTIIATSTALRPRLL